MTVFAILLPSPQPAVVEAIKKAFPSDYLSISETQWLVSAVGTAADIVAKIGVYDAKEPNKSPTGNAVVFATSGYYGRGPSNIWEWLKSKLEAIPNG